MLLMERDEDSDGREGGRTLPSLTGAPTVCQTLYKRLLRALLLEGTRLARGHANKTINKIISADDK